MVDADRRLCRELRAAGIAAAVGALVVLASGCGAASLDPVQKAAAATDQQSAKMQMTMQVSTAKGAFTADGSGAFRQGEGKLAMTVHAGGKAVPFQKKVGSAQIGGVETAHYRVAVDLKKLAADDPRAATGLGRLESQTGVATIPVDVWIDGSNHVRRLQLRMSMPGSGAGRLQMSLTMSISGFGVPVDLELPPASKTVDLTSQVESKKTSE